MIGVGVIGLGFIGLKHARVYREISSTKLVAVCDVVEEKAKSVASELGAKKWYVDYEKLLRDPDVEAVSICTPDSLHRDPVVRAAEARKHILLEKPLSTTLEDADAIISSVESAHVKMEIGFVLRFDPTYFRAKELVSEGAIGEPKSVHGRRVLSGSDSLEYMRRLATSFPIFLGVHDFDAMRWTMNTEVESVYAEGVKKSQTARRVQVHDAVWALMRFRNGAIGCYETGGGRPEPHTVAKLEITGTEGCVVIDCFSETGGMGTMRLIDKEGVKPLSEVLYWPEVHGRIGGALREEIEHFARYVLDEEGPATTLQDGRAATEVALAVHESLNTGKPVRLPLKWDPQLK